jgi:hypothetical protein
MSCFFPQPERFVQGEITIPKRLYLTLPSYRNRERERERERGRERERERERERDRETFRVLTVI